MTNAKQPDPEGVKHTRPGRSPGSETPETAPAYILAVAHSSRKPGYWKYRD